MGTVAEPKRRLKFIAAGFLLCLPVVALLLFFLLREVPLPFNPDAFVATSKFPALSAKPGLAQRAEHLLLVAEDRIFDHTPRAFSISLLSVRKWDVQYLLTSCTDYSGTRYLISKDLAAGTVSFGTTSAMNGPQFISAIEAAVSGSDVTWLDSSNVWRTESLALLRFPEAKTVVVLPKSEVADFLRTNGIDPHRFDNAKK